MCNYTSCKLGLNLQKQLSAHSSLECLSVAHNAPATESTFQAFLNEQADRDRLIAYLKQNNLQIKNIVFNQPFKLRPVVDDPLDANSDDEKDEDKLSELKDKVRILIETPLFTVADLNENELLSEDACYLSL